MSERTSRRPPDGARVGFVRGRRLFRLRHRHRTVMMGQGTVTVGRRQSCDIVLTSLQVSREHARIIVGEQSAAIEDLSSHNGVFVNGKRVRGMQRLNAGDRIGIGDETIEVLGFADETLLLEQDLEETSIGSRPIEPFEDDGDPIPTVVAPPSKKP